MENRVGIRELKQNASKVIQEVKEGEIITVTEHGVPVAKIVPISTDRYQELIDDGTLIPPTTKFDIRKIKPIKLPDGITSELLLAAEREDKI
jgi:prevent-host-death family protein